MSERLDGADVVSNMERNCKTSMSYMRSAMQPGIHRLLELYDPESGSAQQNEELDPREGREIMRQCRSWDKTGMLPRDFYVST